MGNQRWRVTQVTTRDCISARQVVFSCKIKTVFQATTTINRRTILTVLRQIGIDLGSLLNINVSNDIGGATAAFAGHQNHLVGSVIEVSKCYHTFIYRSRELRDVIFHDISNIGARKQSGIGAHIHHVSMALDCSIDIGQALAKELRQVILLTVHELHFTSLGFEVDNHVVKVTHVHISIEQYRAAVGAGKPVVVKRNDIVLDRDAVCSQHE